MVLQVIQWFTYFENSQECKTGRVDAQKTDSFMSVFHDKQVIYTKLIL